MRLRKTYVTRDSAKDRLASGTMQEEGLNTLM